MKTLQEFLKHYVDSDRTKDSIAEAMKAYAQSCCETLREEIAERAEIHWPVENNLNPTVDREAIRNHPIKLV